MSTSRLQLTILLVQTALLSTCLAETTRPQPPTDLYLVPNFHPGCMGWLVRYSEERNYCLYAYLSHLERVAKDPAYKFAFSEIPHLITMMEYEPARFEEFKRQVHQGRIECVNAFVLEPTVSLSGGEALVQQGIQGLRWYKQVMDLQPRYCWMIDTVGWHEQMAQIVSGLGLDAFVYCRYNPTGSKPRGSAHTGLYSDWSAAHWIQSPDGTKALALSPGSYANRDFRALFESKTAVAQDELRKLIAKTGAYRDRGPAGAPILILGGQADYALPFHYEKYPTELITAWNKDSPGMQLHIATPSDYLDAILPGLRAGRYHIPTVTGGSATYGWASFWMNAPIVKQWYRQIEHSLQAAESLATIGSLNGPMLYTSQAFGNSWLLMSLNMDRNVLWGVMVDSSFRDAQSWDTCDRFEYVETNLTAANEAAFHALAQPEPETVTLFNPVNWTRQGPTEVRLPPGRALAGIDCQLLEDGDTMLADVALPSMGLTSSKLAWAGLIPPAKTDLPETIETSYYIARIDADTGALISLKLKPSGREVLSGPSNVVLVETKGRPHGVPEKADRTLVASSSAFKPFITVTTGKLATIVQMRSAFHAGGELRRVIRFYNDSPRIDFLTETNGLPDGVILSVEFPLADEITEMRRGIPYGFSHGDCTKQNPGVTGLTKGRGFAGGMKRWNFKGGPASHGSKFHRMLGSVGHAASPSKIFKGKKMPGHYGVERVTTENLKVIKVVAEENLLLVRGAVPGATGGMVLVRAALKKRSKKKQK